MKKKLGLFCVAIAVGFLGANPIADASGFTSDAVALKLLSGILAGCLALTAIVFGEVQLRNLITVLARTKQRPGTAVVIVLLCGGIICFTAAVLLQLLGGPEASVKAANNSVSAKLNLGSSIMVPVTTLALLIAGAILVGLGVWGSIPPGSQDTESKESLPK